MRQVGLPELPAITGLKEKVSGKVWQGQKPLGVLEGKKFLCVFGVI